jgi:hypothetical protein
MSRKASDWAWQYKAPSSSTKIVLLALANRANEYDECFPSIKRLALDTVLDRKTVMKGLTILIKSGVLLDTGKRKGVSQRVKVYRLVISSEIVPFAGSFLNRDYPESGTEDKPQKGTINKPQSGTQNQSVESVKETNLTSSESERAKASAQRFETLWHNYARMTGGASKVGSKKAAFKTWQRLTKGFDDAKLRYLVNVCLTFQEMRLADKSCFGANQHCVTYLNQEVWLSDDSWLQAFNEQYERQLADEKNSEVERGILI